MISILRLTVLATLCVELINADTEPVVAKSIYKIINKADNGAITVNNSDSETKTEHPQVFIRPYHDYAGQKWKTHQPLLYKSFELKPTSNTASSLDVDTSTLNLYGKMDASGDQKYWYIKDMGEGAFQVKNLMYGTCLTSQGLNKLAVLANCENSPQQQWVFSKL